MAANFFFINTIRYIKKADIKTLIWYDNNNIGVADIL